MINTIRTELKSMIGTMKKTNGFQFDWDAPDRSDKAYWGDVSAFVSLPFEEPVNEDNAYLHNSLEVSIDIRAKVSDSTTPVEDADVKLGKCLVDIKQKFTSNPQINNDAFHIKYNGFDMETVSGDRLYPRKMRTVWLVSYYQKRSDPNAT